MTQPVLDPNELDPSGELAAQIEAQRREYGTYVATQKIFAGNALAYNVGHPVPISNVVKHGYFLNGQVALVDGAEHDPGVAASIAPTDATPDATLESLIETGYQPDAAREAVVTPVDEEGEGGE
jgi:hypothetical protein